tara:strand:+ start:1245 stop:1478 length:234 start_codon:yes stop_codon:yes gene_type:complete
MGYKLKKDVAGSKSFRYASPNIYNGKLTKYEVGIITQQQLKSLFDEGCPFVVSDTKKIVKKKKSSDESKKEQISDID